MIFRAKWALKSQSYLSGGVSGAGGFYPKPGFGRPMQRARPGSTDCPGAGMQRVRGDHVRVEQRGPDSNLTLHYLWLCSYYAMKVMVEKVSSNLPPGKVNSSGEAPAAGARVGAGRFLAPLRGKIHFFASFSANCEKPPPPRIEPTTSPTFA